MKIAVIAHVNYPISKPFSGGMEMFTHVLTEALIKRGHDVTLFALPGSDPKFKLVVPPMDVFDIQADEELRADNPGFEPGFANNFNAHLWIMRYIQTGGFDVVHNNSLHFLPIMMADLATCPVVTTFHSPPFPALQSAVTIAGTSPANHFVAVSRYLGSTWARYTPEFQVIHNGMDPACWTFNPAPKPKTAIWVGRICPEKGTHYAIEAARMAGYEIEIVGTIFDQQYFDREVAPRLGADARFTGHLGHEEMSVAIGRAEVGLFTSTWEEPFGLVVIEMLACGTPVVAFDGGAVPEILTEDCGILVKNMDRDALAAAIPAAAKLDRSACRARALHAFPISRMVDAYEELYAAVAVPPKPVLGGATRPV